MPRRVRLLLDANLALSTEHNLDALLQRFTDIACELTSARYGALFVEDVGTLVTFVTHGLTQEEAERIGEPPSRTGFHGQLLHEGRTVVIDDVTHDPRATGYPSFHPVMRSFLGTPIKAGGRVIGQLYLAEKRRGQKFDARDVEILESLAAIAGVAYRNTIMTQIAEQTAARTRALLGLRDHGQLDEALFWSQVWAREEERARLARDIHDEQGQLLTSIILFAKHLEQNVDSQVSTYAADLRMLAERALRAARSLAQQLRPLELDEVGLGPALHRVAEQTAQSCGTTIDVVANAPSTPLSYPAEVVVYRIAQEALTNIARHAHATSASVTLSTHDGWLTLLIEDDGVGFEPEPVLEGRGIAGHVGLRTMRERAASIGGEFVVEARHDAGTLVRLRVPISDGAHVRPAKLTSSRPVGRQHLSSDQRDDTEARP